MSRVQYLDYLRGLAAFGIMIYHYLSWTFMHFDSQSFMGRVGTYGVSIFYVLSGITLYHVYGEKMVINRHDVWDFAKKRIFRIFPLLWLASLLSLAMNGTDKNAWEIFLGMSGLFGFLKWDCSPATGAWSIGNELVFYAFFPVFIFFAKKTSKLGIGIITLILFIIYCYFAFVIIHDNVKLQEQWTNYVNPLNQVFLFLGGFLIGMIFKNTPVKSNIALFSFALGVLIFTCYPANGDRVVIVTGFTRLVLSLSCFLICFGFFKLQVALPTILGKSLSILGEISYSVYLLHPIVINILSLYIKKVSIVLVLSVISTLVLSYFVYQYYEKFFIQLGKKKALTA